MMRFGLAAAVLAGCASAGQGLAPGDGPGGGQQDAPAVSPDADVVRDAPAQHDARVYMDAHVYEDAHVYQDAHVYMDAPPCTPHTTELLTNPALDLTPTGMGWNQTPIDPAYPLITNTWATPDSPPNVLWMGGITGADEGTSSVTDIAYQDITVPANTTQLVLTGTYQVGTDETTSTVHDTGTVGLIETSGTPIETALALSNLTTTTAWTAMSHTFTTNLSGQTVRLRFTTTNDTDNGTGFLFDTLSLKATHCP